MSDTVRVRLLKPHLVGLAVEPMGAVVDLDKNQASYFFKTFDAEWVDPDTPLSKPQTPYTKKRQDNETADSMNNLAKVITEAITKKSDPKPEKSSEEDIKNVAKK